MYASTSINGRTDERTNVEWLVYLFRIREVLDAILDPESSDPGEFFMIQFRITL
jgi:hypothetical protein